MFNKAILIGRLCADPELRQTSSGIYVCSYRIAVDRRFSRDAERKADFLSVVSWRQQGEFVSKYFHKGDPIGVEGSRIVVNGAGDTKVEVFDTNGAAVYCGVADNMPELAADIYIGRVGSTIKKVAVAQ